MIYDWTHSTLGDDTEVKVCYEYEPAQKEILAPNEAAQPGFPARIELCEVLIDGDDVLDDLNSECIGRLEQACWAHFEARAE